MALGTELKLSGHRPWDASATVGDKGNYASVPQSEIDYCLCCTFAECVNCLGGEGGKFAPQGRELRDALKLRPIGEALCREKRGDRSRLGRIGV